MGWGMKVTPRGLPRDLGVLPLHSEEGEEKRVEEWDPLQAS